MRPVCLTNEGSMRVLWKMLRGDAETPLSHHDNSEWRVGEWRDVLAEYKSEWGDWGNPRIEACEFGFHACPTLVECFMFVEPGVIALVEVDGDSDEERDNDYEDDEFYRSPLKSAHQRMRLVRVWEWTEEDYKALFDEIGRYEAETGDTGDHYQTVEGMRATCERNGYQYGVSYLLDRRMSQAAWDHINKWWERRLLGNAAD